jgi:pimeloyl-ACP methyl ester carboxylesterase
MEIAIRELPANNMTFRCRVAGDLDDASREAVVLLHGFPETSHMWVQLMPVLAGAGYRCLAPDQRGYSPGARPDAVEAYAYGNLASDVFALADAAGFDRFHLVGHDWGALVGWACVSIDGGARIASYTSLSIPHALAFARAVYDDPEEEPYRQILNMLLTEGVFENLILQDGGAGFRRAYDHSTPEEVDEYISVLSAPGAMKSAASWYRASRAHKRSLEGPDSPFAPVTVPALLIWGSDDPYVRRMSVDLAPEYMRGPYRVVELAAGHWLAQQEPERVAADVLAHIREHPARQ